MNVNLDDEEEVRAFIAKHGTCKGRRLANQLGLTGKGADSLATSLSCFAWNRLTAMNLRLAGNIARAQVYEDICDRIYKRDLTGKVSW